MTTRSRRNHSSQSGYSMAEILVATAIFAVIIVAALAVYDSSNKVFKKSVESADVQQNTRVAFNRLVSDLRMAGFDFDRDGIPSGATVDTRENSKAYNTGALVTDAAGNVYRAAIGGTTGSTVPTFSTAIGATTLDGASPGGVTWVRVEGTNQYQQPDEQIEYAGRTAITLRGNLDYETAATTENGRETAFEPEGGQFPVVTTGNDEIVTYALVSLDASKNDNSISFWADIAKPRAAYPGGSAETEVTIDGIDTDLDSNGMPANPPYTLYRITLNDNGTLNRVPVADNIRSVRYTYYEDQAGRTTLKDLANAAIPTSGVAANTGIIGGDGKYDPANVTLVPQREVRKKIRAVRLDLTGMAPYPDRDYTNPDETNAAIRTHRTYTLATTIVPRNLGKHGMREQSTKEPGVPSITRVCRGGCGVLFVEWNAPKVTAEAGAVDQYQVEYGHTLVSGALVVTGQSSAGSALSVALPPLNPPTTEWYVQVKAVNTYGSKTSVPVKLTGGPLNSTKPLAPTNVTATNDQIGKIVVSWTGVVGNVTGVSQTCTTGTLSGDIIRNPAETVYRVWRNTVDDATGATGTMTQLWTGASTGAVAPYAGPAPAYDAATAKFTFVDNTVPNCASYYYFVEAMDKYCYADGATNTSGTTALAKSGPSASGLGIAVSGGLAPSPPSELRVNETLSSCAGVSCTVHLYWPRVTTDSAGNPISVTKYAVRTVTKYVATGAVVTDDLNDPEIVTVPASQDPVTWSSGKTKMTATGDEVYFEFQVAAQQCDTPGPALRSDFIPTPPRKYPCNWNVANTVDILVSGTPYEGTGLSLAEAWVVTDPTSVIVNLASAVSAIKATFQVISPVATSAVTLPTQTDTASASFGFPANPTNGQTWQIDFELTDASGCKRFISRYVFDSPTTCCLLPTFFDSSLISSTSRTITVKLQNICDVPITLQTNGLRVLWNTGYVPGNAVESILWPGLGTTATNVNDTSGAFSRTPPTGATTTIGANSSNYLVTLTFKKNINASVLTGFCATYLQSGDSANSSCRVVASPTDTNLSTCP